MEESPTIGKITIDSSVLRTIARLTTLAVPGVVRMTPPMGFQRLLGLEDGVRVLVQDGKVRADLHIVVESDRNLLALGRRIQAEVTRAIEDMVGMEVDLVNVHIEDIGLPPEERRRPEPSKKP